MSSDAITILIADDHPLFRKGLRALLATLPQARVVGEAATGAEAVRLAAQLRPDVVLMDLQMPGGDGLAAVRQIAAAQPEVRVLVVTMFQDDDSIFAAMRAGARGYVLKDMDDDDITRAILAVGRGDAIFSPAIAARMMTFFSTSSPQPIPLFPRTDRERTQRVTADGQGVEQRHDRAATGAQPQNGAQLHQHDLQ